MLMVDELLSAYPHQLSFSEAGMRIMITSHFSPRTRLTMASRMLITEVGGGTHVHTHTHTQRGQIGTALLCQGTFIQPGRNNMIHLNNRRVQCPTGFRG